MEWKVKAPGERAAKAFDPAVGQNKTPRRANSKPGPKPRSTPNSGQCGCTADPMNSAERKVKIYACKKATNNSRRLSRITPTMLAGITR